MPNRIRGSRLIKDARSRIFCRGGVDASKRSNDVSSAFCSDLGSGISMQSSACVRCS